MSKNAQILLENLIEQEFQGNESYGNISDYFEFFSARACLKIKNYTNHMFLCPFS